MTRWSSTSSIGQHSHDYLRSLQIVTVQAAASCVKRVGERAWQLQLFRQ